MQGETIKTVGETFPGSVFQEYPKLWYPITPILLDCPDRKRRRVLVQQEQVLEWKFGPHKKFSLHSYVFQRVGVWFQKATPKEKLSRCIFDYGCNLQIRIWCVTMATTAIADVIARRDRFLFSKISNRFWIKNDSSNFLQKAKKVHAEATRLKLNRRNGCCVSRSREHLCERVNSSENKVFLHRLKSRIPLWQRNKLESRVAAGCFPEGALSPIQWLPAALFARFVQKFSRQESLGTISRGLE